MCGIYLHISSHKQGSALSSDVEEYLAHRGPDALKYHKVKLVNSSHTWHISIAASVLSLRGDTVEEQPKLDASLGSVFAWNGEAWYDAGCRVSGNDTSLLATKLFNTVRDSTDISTVLSQALSTIQGPYAFVLLDAEHQILYFGRDPLGRRSLLSTSRDGDDAELTICSIDATSSPNASEIDVTSLHMLDLTSNKLDIRKVSFRSCLPTINRIATADETSLAILPSSDTVDSLIRELKRSLQPRIEDVPTYNATGTTTNPSRVAILFSGGLDCTLLARLVHDILPKDQPIDLLNVGFENPRVINAREAKGSLEMTTDSFELCPDRITGRSSFAELQTICHSRSWRFVAVNVPYSEFQAHRPTIIRLMYPHNTEMDLSISAALYFAARGQGQLFSSDIEAESSQEYKTTARVLLSGLGADELFGGYARHAAAFGRGGFAALNDELELDFARIGHRNLGRDDRIISHWAREIRYPFLDEQFVCFALNLPAWEKCGFRLGKTIPKHFEKMPSAKDMQDLHPEKLLLRCAAWRLGMRGAAAEKKRAIQFGARTAKMHAGRTKGTDAIASQQVV